MSSEVFIYISLIWLLSILITFLMLFLCYLYLSMRRAEERESRSMAFSHLVLKGLETERQRVSRELHDTVLPVVDNPAVAKLIRSISRELAAPDFAHFSFKNALVDLCAEFTQKTNIECVPFIEESLDFAWLPPESQLHLYRIVQESFTNIAKHSQTEKAVLVVRNSEGNLLIIISDEGIGLQSGSGSGSVGLGMGSMKQRAAIIGAKLDFISEAGDGLMVRIELLPPPPSEKDLNYGRQDS